MSYNYDLLWQPIQINGCTIKNRICMSAMETYTPRPTGEETENGIDYYVERAKGGIGLIHTGASFITKELAQGCPGYGVYDVYNIANATNLTENVHRYGAKIFLQMSPGTGRNSRMDAGHPAIPVSASPNPAFFNPGVNCREMSKEEIKQTVEDFKVAAQWAVWSGFDGIQLHSHAGYLFDQFLSSCWNHRTDEYGGSLENRCRFTKEVVEAIREVVGPTFPITYRFAVDHAYFKGGRGMEEGLEILKTLDKCSIDAFDLDAGCYETQDYVFPTRYVGDACMQYVCAEARKVLTKPIINAGNHTMETASKLLESGNADMISFGRQSIADPQFANKLRDGLREDIRPCILCNEECVGRVFGRRASVSCTVNPSAGFEARMRVTPVSKPTNVVVIGAGPGGMEAARCAAERGCSVTLFEAGDRLGGTFLTIATGDFKSRMRTLVKWYERQLEKLGVKIVLNTRVNIDDPILKSADKIFVATGSKLFTPPIPGIDNKKVISVVDVHRNGLPEGKNVVICGGGLSACDTALEYGQEGRNITIVEMRSKLGADVMVVNAVTINRKLNEYGVNQLVNTKVIGINDEGVLVENENGSQETLPADVIVSAFGMAPNMDFPNLILKTFPKKATIIGDCHKPAKGGNAIREGFYAAMAIE